MADTAFSYEFFPPRTPLGERRFWRAVGHLETMDPAFFSITYGALGSGQEQSITAVEAVAAECDTPLAAHLTFEGSTVAEIDDVAGRMRDFGVDRIVALRGDAREDAAAAKSRGPCYQSVPEFIEGLLKIHPFDISVACYPEVHPRASDQMADLRALKDKCDAGANRAITQFFFDVDQFERFRDAAVAMGITVPIVAGVLPIRDFAKVRKFAQACDATIPQNMINRFDAAQGSAESCARLAQEEFDSLIENLVDRECKSFHVYTLNQVVTFAGRYGPNSASPAARVQAAVA